MVEIVSNRVLYVHVCVLLQFYSLIYLDWQHFSSEVVIKSEIRTLMA